MAMRAPGWAISRACCGRWASPTRLIGGSSRSSPRGSASSAMMTLRPARRWRLSRRCSGPPACNAGSPVRHFDAEQRAVVLAAEDVGIARAAARAGAADREFDREGGVELVVIGNAVILDAENPAHRCARQHTTPPHILVIGAL